MSGAAVQTEGSKRKGILLSLVRPGMTRAQRLKDIEGMVEHLRSYADDPERLLHPNARATFFDVLDVIDEQARRLARMK